MNRLQDNTPQGAPLCPTPLGCKRTLLLQPTPPRSPATRLSGLCHSGSNAMTAHTSVWFSSTKPLAALLRTDAVSVRGRTLSYQARLFWDSPCAFGVASRRHMVLFPESWAILASVLQVSQPFCSHFRKRATCRKWHQAAPVVPLFHPLPQQGSEALCTPLRVGAAVSGRECGHRGSALVSQTITDNWCSVC